MIRIFAKHINFNKIKNGHLGFFYILQLTHTAISNSEKLTHPIVYPAKAALLKISAWTFSSVSGDSFFLHLNSNVFFGIH